MNQNLKKINFISIISIIFILLLYKIFSHKSPLDSVERAQYPVNITTAYANAKILVAQEKGYFHKHGLNVELNFFSLGRDALNSMLKDESIKLALAYETPVIKELINGHSIQVLTTMHQSTQSTKLIVKSNKNSFDAEFFKGKKFAVTLNTSMEFAFIHYINSLGLNASDVIIVDVKPEDITTTALDPSINGIMVWDDYVDSTVSELARNSVAYQTPNLGYTEFSFLISNINTNKTDIDNQTKFILALLEAQHLYETDRGEFIKSFLRYRRNFGLYNVNYEDAATHLNSSKSIFGFNNLSSKVLQQEFDYFCMSSKKCDNETIERLNKLINTKIIESTAPDYLLIEK